MTIVLHKGKKKSIHLVKKTNKQKNPQTHTPPPNQNKTQTKKTHQLIWSCSVAYLLVKYIPPKRVFWGKGGKGILSACFQWSNVTRLFTYANAKSKSN